MAGVAEHGCDQHDEMGEPVRPEATGCGKCGRAWCDRCDPTGAAWGCHHCHGRGYTTAPVPPRQARKLFDYYPLKER